MPAGSVDAEADFVAGGHVLSGAEPEGPDFQLRFDVLADDGADVIPFEGLFGQHERRSAGIALLAGLEQSEDRAAERRVGRQLLQDTV